MKLREYQARGIRELRAVYASGKRAPAYVSPTGSGKTVVAAEVMRLAVQKGTRVLFVAGRVELLDQTVRKLADAGISDVRVIQAENDTANGSPVIVASVQTLASKRWRGALPPADLLVPDEAHHLKARTWLDIAHNYPAAKILALTATPERGDGSPLGDILDAIVVGATIRELIDLKCLVQPRVYAPPSILDTRSLAMDPVDAYFKYANGKRTIVFAGTVEHAAKIAADFRDKGVKAEHVSGSMQKRPDIIRRYTAGEFDVLVNVALVIEGYDDPSTEAVIFAKRFTHAGGFLQACGRPLRPYPGKSEATIVDLCGSALVHGTPDLERTYSLDGKAIRTSDRESLRQCPACFGVCANAGPRCAFCGHEYPALQRQAPRNANVELGEVTAKTPPTSWPMRAKKPGVCSTCRNAIEQGTWIIYSKIYRTAQHTRCASARKAA